MGLAGQGAKTRWTHFAREHRGVAAALAIAFATAVAYSPVVDAGYIWDDGDYVTHNDTLTSWAGLPRIWLEAGAIPQYYPLVHTSYWLEYRLWGLVPLGYHATNVLLHILAALLFGRVCVVLGVRGAWWAAAVFALHPVHVESVAWITERKNVLSGVFYFASLLAYLRWSDLPGLRGGARGSEGWYTASLVLFVCALLSKTVTATLPAVVLVIAWWRGRRLDRSTWGPLVPHFVLGIGFGLFTRALETHQVGATGAPWDLSLLDRCWVAGRALWFYLGKLAWPVDLSFNYARWQVDPGSAWQAVFPIAAVAAAVALWLARRRIGRGPLAAALIFAGSLVPALGFFDVYPMRYAFVADHFQYLASAAPIALVAALGAVAGERTQHPRVAVGVGLVLLCALGTLTWNRTHVYRDAETLWRATVRVNPDSWLAHSHLCSIEHDRGHLDTALRHCEQTLRLEPDNHETHHLFGILEMSRGRTEEAIRHHRRAIELDPGFVHSRSALASALVAAGRHEEAIVELRALLARHPDYAQAHTNLGHALAAVGETDEAIREHRRALELMPDLVAAHRNLASALAERGDLEGARRHLLRWIELEPEASEARRSLRALEQMLEGGGR